jgi:hypothetical protein
MSIFAPRHLKPADIRNKTGDVGRDGFHMRGNAYRGLQEFIERTVPGGLTALLEALTEPNRSFFNQTFLTGAWYDYFPVEEITQTAARLLGESHTMFLRGLADFILKRDANGLYRAILRFATPQLVVHALPFAANRYYDFSKLSVHDVSERSCLVRVHGIPAVTAMTYITTANVFVIRAIESAGGRNVVCQSTAPVSAGSAHGEPIAKFERRFSWTL